MKWLLLCSIVLGLSACHDRANKASAKAQPTQEQRKSNPLLNLQNKTVHKAQKAINQAVDAQQKALDRIDQ